MKSRPNGESSDRLSDERKLENLQLTLDAAVLDSRKWVDVCDRLADFIGGVGTAIVPEAIEYQTDKLIVRSAVLDELTETIVRDGWVNRNYRRRAIPIIKQRGFATDYDIADEVRLRAEPFYSDLLASHDLGVFVGLHVPTPGHTFIAGVERSRSAPPPDEDMFERVKLAIPLLGSAARASVAIAAPRLEAWRDLASEGNRAAFLLDPLGRVIDLNEAAEGLVAATALELSAQRLRLSDPREDHYLCQLIAAACAQVDHAPLPRPVFTTVQGQGTLMFDAVRIPASLRFFHTFAVAILLARPVGEKVGSLPELLRAQSGLTAAEVKVALALFEGQSLSDYAKNSGISIGTARQQIKAVFRKTGTGRQNELSALIRRVLENSRS